MLLVLFFNRHEFQISHTDFFEDDIMDLARAKLEMSAPGVVQDPVPVLAFVEGQQKKVWKKRKRRRRRRC